MGLLTGLFGVGGGFLIIPALVLLLSVEMTAAVGTSLAIIVVNSLASLASHLEGGGVDWPLAVAFVGSAMLASLLGGRFGTRIDTRRLRRWFAWFVVAVAAFMLGAIAFGY